MKKIILIFLFLSFSSCSSISQYTHYAYVQTVNLKVDSLNLMDHAVNDYSSYGNEVKELLLRIEKAYEYEKGRPKNDITIKQWEILKNPERDSLGGFLKYWKEEKKLKKVIVESKKEQISNNFDQIIGLESGKIKK